MASDDDLPPLQARKLKAMTSYEKWEKARHDVRFVPHVSVLMLSVRAGLLLLLLPKAMLLAVTCCLLLPLVVAVA